MNTNTDNQTPESLAEEPVILTEQEKAILKAWNDGEAWAKGLKAGDIFEGSGPAAEAAGYKRGSLLYGIFLNASFPILESLDIFATLPTDRRGDVVITRIAPRS